MRALRFLIPALLLLILPFLVNERRAVNSGYVADTLDPEWSYLANAVLVAEGRTPGHIDHPGTPVQTLGALVFRAHHLAAGGPARLAEDVFSHPVEHILLGARATFVASMITLVIAGWIFLAAGGLFYVVFLQQAAFLAFPSVFLEITRFKPDLWVGATAVLAWSVFSLAWKRPARGAALALGAVIGFGLALKLNFLPFLVLPFFLPRECRRREAFGAAGLSFVLFTLPAWKRYGDMLSFLWTISTENGQYNGTPEILSLSRMLAVGERLFGMTVFAGYVASFALFAAACALLVAGAAALRRAPRDGWKLVAPALVVVALNVLMVLKHPSDNQAPAVRYLMPALASLVSLLPLTVQALGGRVRHAVLPLALFSAALYWMPGHENVQIFPPMESAGPLPPEHHFYAERLLRTSRCSFILDSGPTTEVMAADFANKWSRGVYAGLLARLYPLGRSYVATPGGIRSLLGVTRPYAEVRRDVKSGGCYLLLTNKRVAGASRDPAWDPAANLATRDVTAANLHALYDGVEKSFPDHPFVLLDVQAGGSSRSQASAP